MLKKAFFPIFLILITQTSVWGRVLIDSSQNGHGFKVEYLVMTKKLKLTTNKPSESRPFIKYFSASDAKEVESFLEAYVEFLPKSLVDKEKIGQFERDLDEIRYLSSREGLVLHLDEGQIGSSKGTEFLVENVAKINRAMYSKGDEVRSVELFKFDHKGGVFSFRAILDSKDKIVKYSLVKKNGSLKDYSFRIDSLGISLLGPDRTHVFSFPELPEKKANSSMKIQFHGVDSVETTKTSYYRIIQRDQKWEGEFLTSNYRMELATKDSVGLTTKEADHETVVKIPHLESYIKSLNDKELKGYFGRYGVLNIETSEPIAHYYNNCFVNFNILNFELETKITEEKISHRCIRESFLYAVYSKIRSSEDLVTKFRSCLVSEDMMEKKEGEFILVRDELIKAALAEFKTSIDKCVPTDNRQKDYAHIDKLVTNSFSLPKEGQSARIFKKKLLEDLYTSFDQCKKDYEEKPCRKWISGLTEHRNFLFEMYLFLYEGVENFTPVASLISTENNNCVSNVYLNGMKDKRGEFDFNYCRELVVNKVLAEKKEPHVLASLVRERPIFKNVDHFFSKELEASTEVIRACSMKKLESISEVFLEDFLDIYYICSKKYLVENFSKFYLLAMSSESEISEFSDGKKATYFSKIKSLIDRKLLGSKGLNEIDQLFENSDSIKFFGRFLAEFEDYMKIHFPVESALRIKETKNSLKNYLSYRSKKTFEETLYDSFSKFSKTNGSAPVKLYIQLMEKLYSATLYERVLNRLKGFGLSNATSHKVVLEVSSAVLGCFSKRKEAYSAMFSACEKRLTEEVSRLSIRYRQSIR